jgi:hypothetical protein
LISSSTGKRGHGVWTVPACCGALALAGLLGGCGAGHSASADGGPPKATALERREELQAEAARKRHDVAKLESAVLADGKILARGGVVRGPIVGVHCSQIAGVSSSQLSSSEGAYDCLAFNRDEQVEHHGHIVEGIHFYGRIDFLHSGVYDFGGDPQAPPFVPGS